MSSLRDIAWRRRSVAARSTNLAVALLVAATCAVAGCERAPVLVDDSARLMSSGQVQRLQTFHRLLLQDHDIDYHVITIGTPTANINRHAVDLFESLKVGTRSKGGRGLLLVLDAAGNRVRLEVSRALEAVYPDAYLRAMASHDGDATLPVYSAATQAMLAQWVMTTAQMDNVVKAYRDCQAPEQFVAATGGLAVIRYPIERRQCSPWFFVREGGAWRLDLATQQKVVGFGRDNSWHLNLKISTGNSYRFAFEDWVFDRGGFPVRQR